MAYLERISDPADLQQFSERELKLLSQELRDTILACMSEVGGHLAASLGTVELTVALHSVLESPRDKIVWDVGHQCYAHKLLTGRRERFGTIRQYGGLCGFPNRAESEHDIIGTGHASTSISYGLGLVEAARLARVGGSVVCVLGDGALTGGVAFEALNQAGHLRTPLVVVLNDNEMSIRANVGAMQLYLNRIRLDPTLTRFREDLERGVARIPAIGPQAYRLGKDVKESMKALMVPGMLFEELGFAYIGVVDGHDIHALRLSIRQAVETRRPVVVHVRTIKGKGYKPAEKQPDAYHGTAPFHLGDGARKVAAVGTTYTQAFGQALVRLAESDPRVVAITAAMTQGTGLEEFERRFPDRFYDVGIAEEHAAVFAAGLAIGGMRPVVAIYSTFLQRAFDMLVQDIGLQQLPVVFAVDRAGLVGDDGPTHHGAFDLSYLRVIPNMTVMAPSSLEELQRMLRTALELDGPAAIRYPRGMAAPFVQPRTIEPLPVGRGVIVQEGCDVALVGIGTGVGIAVEAAALLEAQGEMPTVVDARFVKPLDEELLLELAATHKRLVTVEENALAGGFGSAVLEKVGALVPVMRFGLPDAFVPHGDRARLLQDIGLTPQAVALAAAVRPASLARVKKGAVRERLDALLVSRGFFATRAQARTAILAGEVHVGDRLGDKPGTMVDQDAALRVAVRPRFVSRGGDKLDHALEAFGVNVSGEDVCDLGSSTGGFVDRLLQGGAARVAAVDVGYGQLDWRLREDPRVTVLERTNARYLTAECLPFAPSFVTADLSFISLTVALGPVLESLRDGYRGLVLVKPQFEAGRDRVGKGGVVRDPEVQVSVLEAVCAWLAERGAAVLGVCDSGHPGPKGNVEYFVYFCDGHAPLPATPVDPSLAAAQAVAGAHA